jgi:hypothetical protein
MVTSPEASASARATLLQMLSIVMTNRVRLRAFPSLLREARVLIDGA